MAGWKRAERGLKNAPLAGRLAAGIGLAVALVAPPSLPVSAPVSILVSFRLDPWLISGNYGSGFWVSPTVFGPAIQSRATFAIEVRAGGVDSQGQSVDIAPRWTVSDPSMVSASVTGPRSAILTVLRPGHSAVVVAQDAAATELSIDAVSVAQGSATQVTIAQRSKIATALTFSFPPGGGVATSSAEGSTAVYYGKMSATTDVLAFANFSYWSGAGAAGSPVLITEAGISAVPVVNAARIFVDYSTNSNSGFAVVNPGMSGITVRADLRDAGGAAIVSMPLTIGPGSHTAMFVDQLMPGLPEPFLGTLTLESRDGFAAANLNAARNPRNDTLYSSLPVADLRSPPAGSSLIFPQVLDGGGDPTSIMLMNPSGTLASVGKVELFDDHGAPLALDFGGPAGSQSELQFSIEPNGMLKLATSGRGSLRAGYAVVTVGSGPLPIGNSVLEFTTSSGLVSRAGVQDSRPTTSARMFIEVASTPLIRTTGIATVNPGTTEANLLLTLTGFDGSNRETTLTLGPNEHRARFITQLFPELPPEFRGVLAVSGSHPASILTLRLTINQRGEPIYSTLPIADLENPPSGAAILPQIVNGGGYETEIIVLGTTDRSGTASIEFHDTTGGAVPFQVLSFR